MIEACWQTETKHRDVGGQIGGINERRNIDNIFMKETFRIGNEGERKRKKKKRET